MSYGERFRLLRERADMTQEKVALALKYKRAAPVSLIETIRGKVPRARTIQKHAAALGCEPWELLAGVATEHDRLRTQPPVTDAELAALLWGLAYLPAAKRRPVVEMFQAFLDTLPTDVTQTRAQTRAPANEGTVKQIHQGKRRA